MDAQQIKDLLENKDVPDEEILEIIKEYLADKYDEKSERIPPNEDELAEIEGLRVLIEKLRPQVMEKFRQDYLIEHGEMG